MRKLKIKFIYETTKRELLILPIAATFLLAFLCLSSHATDVRYSYDSLNRLIRTDYSNGIRVQYAYDETGNRQVKETTQFPDTDTDGYYDNYDNCPEDNNPNQEDTYPPGGNGIGDACDCESDFDCNGNVDAADVTTFLDDFGRNQYNDPCEQENQCKGDFDCNSAVDATDVTKFLEDFGRNQYNNPCPACVPGDWCVY